VEHLKISNVVVTGVGGQGNLLLSWLIASAARLEGYDVQTGETLGMAQRGGPVISFVRYDKRVYSPTVPDHQAHLLIALEPAEALRSIRYIGNSTSVLLNTRKSPSLGVLLGEEKYPDVQEIEGILRSARAKIFAFDAAKLAEKAGNVRSTNVIMLGAMAALENCSIEFRNFKRALKEVLSQKLLEVNMRALNSGYETVTQIIRDSKKAPLVNP
jgi:indolepyruvate ferredoxin oxidoreductase beta subunit